MFSERLKLARKRHVLSLRNLSSRLTGLVSAQAIGKYERGEMMPSSPVVIALAKALEVSTSYLLSSSVLSLQAVEFRKKAATKASEQAMVTAAVLDHVDRYLQVEQLLALDDGDWEMPADAPYTVKTCEDAESAAEALHQAWDLGSGPISNLTELLEERRIKILKLDLPGSLDGLTCFVHVSGGGNVPVVVCSAGRPFTIGPPAGRHILGNIACPTGLRIHHVGLAAVCPPMPKIIVDQHIFSMELCRDIGAKHNRGQPMGCPVIVDEPERMVTQLI